MAANSGGASGLAATLHPDVVAVDPGGSASVEVRVHTEVPTGTLRFEVVGDVAAWSFVVPVVEAGPGSPGSAARVVLRPPRSAQLPAGPVPLAVRVSTEDGDRAGVAEGTVTLGPYVDLRASLEPRTGTGRSSVRYELTLENCGNAASPISFEVAEGRALSVHLHQGSLTVDPGRTSKTDVVVRPDRRLLRGPERTHSFRLAAIPQGGDAVTVAGELVQRPLLRSTAAMGAAAAAVLVVVAVTVAALAGSSDPDAATDDAAQLAAEAAPSGCPAEGHRDTFASGLTPDRIPALPAGYSFTFVKEDGCNPVRWDPCQPVHYVVNPAQAPAGGVADVEEAFARLARVTGMTFVNDGMTDEQSRRGPYVEDRYPGRWAPILVVWNRQSGDRANVEVVGSGFPYRVQDVLVSGTLSLNADAVSDRAKGTPLPDGFGAASGFGAIGAEGVTWGRVILHELAHVVGLGHTRDRDQLMYPDTAQQTSHTTDYRSGDREGLSILGRASGCLESTPAPGPPPARP